MGTSNLSFAQSPLRSAKPVSAIQLDVTTSMLPPYHSWQLSLHELLHALVLSRILQEEAERLEVSVRVSKQAPHWRCHVGGWKGAGWVRLLLAALLADLGKE